MIFNYIDLFEHILEGMSIRLKLMCLLLNRRDELLLGKELLVFELEAVFELLDFFDSCCFIMM